MPLDAEAHDRLAGGGDAIDHALRPAVLDPDHDDGGDIRIRTRADQGAEVQIEIRAELQPPIRMRQGHHTLDVVRHRLGRRVGQIIHGQDDHVVAHAHAAVLAPVAPELGFLADHLALTTAWS